MTFRKFSSIEKLSNSISRMNRNGRGKLNFRSKIKLHGTNAGIRIENGKVSFQKRTSDVTPQNDNAGFANWAQTVNWEKFADNVIVYGEWAGPGVQKTDAVSKIPHKTFFVFSVLSNNNMIVEPEMIKNLVPNHPQIVVLPWFDSATEVDLVKMDLVRDYSLALEEAVEKIGNEDPLVKELFGVSGIGEGLVVSPYSESGFVLNKDYEAYTFKVKSTAHMGEKSKKQTLTYFEVPGSVFEFCDMFATEYRFQQMVDEHCDGTYDMKNTATFLKAVNSDIIKESVEEREKMNVDMKMVSKEINKRAVTWFKRKNSEF